MQKSRIEGVTLLAAWPAHELEGMHQAATCLIVSSSALAEAGQTVVSALMQSEEAVEAWTHYPVRDVIDPASGAQVYYHAHPEHDSRRSSANATRALNLARGSTMVTSLKTAI